MTVTATVRGNPVHWDGSVWRYTDGEPAPGWGGTERPCVSCGLTSDGPDPCLGFIAGATSACCGHGVEQPYIVWAEQISPPPHPAS